MRRVDRARPWWHRLVTALAPAPPDITERLARHHAAEVRLAHGLAQEAESLARYPHPRVRVLDAAEHARGRAQRIRRALAELGHPVAEPTTRSGRIGPTTWDRLRVDVSELGSMSDTYLADAHAVERGHPDIAGLLHDLYRESAGDRRDLIWTLAQLVGTAVNTRSLDAAAA
ncbi:MAG: hypothetical protein WEG40_16615 [Candidatus Rokuibacteriota bacterium]